METVNESLTTIEDGDSTVNERLSPGGKGPEGQPDTATESVTGQPAPAEVPAPEEPTEGEKSAKPKRSKS